VEENRVPRILPALVVQAEVGLAFVFDVAVVQTSDGGYMVGGILFLAGPS
jgi:hypothetical protein